MESFIFRSVRIIPGGNSMRRPDSYGDFGEIANRVGETSSGSQNSTPEALDSTSLQNASGPLSGISSIKASDSEIEDTTAGLDNINKPLLSDRSNWTFDSFELSPILRQTV